VSLFDDCDLDRYQIIPFASVLTEAALSAMYMRKDGLIHCDTAHYQIRSYPDPENPSKRKELVVKLCE
jgi:hypothetical protein